MTREEAIEWLKDIKETGCETMFRDWSYEVALDLAIESLSAEYEDYEHATLVDIKEPLKVLVVRCKDCKWYKACKVFSNNAWHDDDFCSYGERREESEVEEDDE